MGGGKTSHMPGRRGGIAILNAKARGMRVRAAVDPRLQDNHIVEAGAVAEIASRISNPDIRIVIKR